MSVRPEANATADYFWIGSRRLAVLALGSDEREATGLVALAAAKQLLRALADEGSTAHSLVRALDALLPDVEISVACALVDISRSDVDVACLGRGAVVMVDRVEGEDTTGNRNRQAVAADSPLMQELRFWLGLGATGELPPFPANVAGEPFAVEAARDTAGLDALCAVHVRRRSREMPYRTFQVRNTLNAVGDFLLEARHYLETQGVEDASIDRLEIALDELLTNAVAHGFRDGLAHEVLVDIERTAEELRLEIRDDGVPFDPTAIPSPDVEADLETRHVGGLGMHFVKTLAREVSYRREGGWNILHLAFPVEVAVEESRP